MDSFKPLQGYRPSSARLSDQTIYSLSYQVIDKEVAKKCRPAISKPREAPLTQFKLVLPVSSRTMVCGVREFFAIFAICFPNSRTFFVASHRIKSQAAEVIYS